MGGNDTANHVNCQLVTFLAFHIGMHMTCKTSTKSTKMSHIWMCVHMFERTCLLTDYSFIRSFFPLFQFQEVGTQN